MTSSNYLQDAYKELRWLTLRDRVFRLWLFNFLRLTDTISTVKLHYSEVIELIQQFYASLAYQLILDISYTIPC